MNIPRENLLSPAPVAAADVNPAAMRAPGAALQSVGGNIKQVSGEIEHLALKLGRAKDEASMSELRQMQRQIESDMAIFVSENPSQEAWQPELEKRLMEAEQKASSLKFTNAGRTRAMQRYQEWSNAKAGDLAIQATQAEIRRGKMRLMDEFEEGVRMSDPERVSEAIEGLKKFELPETVEQLERDGLRAIEENEFRKLIEESPLEAEERIQSGKLPEWMSESKKRDMAQLTERAKQEARAEEMEILKMAEESGVLRAQDIEAADFISDLDRQLWVKKLQGMEEWNARGQSQAWDKMFDLRESMKDPAITHEQYAAMRNDAEMHIISGIPKEYRGEFNSFMSRHSVANRVSFFDRAEGERRDERKDEAMRRVQSSLKNGLFGEVNSDESHKKAAMARISVINFFENNPEAKMDEALDHVDQIINGTFADTKAIPTLRNAFDLNVRVDRGQNPTKKESGASSALLPPLGALDEFDSDQAAAELDELLSDGE